MADATAEVMWVQTVLNELQEVPGYGVTTWTPST
jgi:hypothetical protein